MEPVMESVQSANIDTGKFLTLDESKATTTNKKWKCCDFALKMLEEGIYADITLRAKGGSVKAHKCVLACVSPVFNAMFEHDMKEKLTSIVDIADMSIEAVQLFLLLLYTTNKVGEEEALKVSLQISFQMTEFNDFFDFDDIQKVAFEYQMPHFNAAIDKHFDAFHKAVLKYQVESKLGFVLISALARNLTPENCWYHFDSSLREATGPFKDSAYFLCSNYILGNYHDVIESQCFREEMVRNPVVVLDMIKQAESRDARKKALEIYLRIKRLLCG